MTKKTAHSLVSTVGQCPAFTLMSPKAGFGLVPDRGNVWMLGGGAASPFLAPFPPEDNGCIQSLQGHMAQKGFELVIMGPVGRI